ncbi:beta-glucosidase-like glycosyl hydrolase/CubicO group peptidase (beta-lactamase class C family) [Filimonas zeae]|uniref:beta-N-acetylhexosaminidase n=1 Tax=Filimonas zeae TaxID=1737353 RepID=A0A917J5X3_9BACT|nr:glycoside hydrolase family 3 N-terminal domain-containing protein [Filimonas zeae]MDR6342254.1 beta-glucosidase-like glycosyl hydrolase/CubicO group peptidase (beta-lactamase class C family) [Filimonas zeae]GGH80606.1 beta-N-acetylglucosaminidase [Filimonas zeae]
MKQFFLLLGMGLLVQGQAQQFLQPSAAAEHWVDSVFNTLSKKEKIAQLMVLRVSEKKGAGVAFYDEQVASYAKKYNIGGICLFQGAPVKQAQMVNRIQQEAATPIMVCIDGETGVGMRFDSVAKFPDQLTMGAMNNTDLVYRVGKAIGEQCKRSGIQVNYAPVVDINNNPNNPVINFRSFGEDKYKVARMGEAITKGMQDAGIMACGKHFPGHGDVAVDSHLDLPVINKTVMQLDSLELYPFRRLVQAGVGSMMVAHLYIPAIDSTPNRATSLSPQNVSGLLRGQLGFNGLTFTDALEMKGVAKFYPAGEAGVQSVIAGNDMLCLPGDIKGTIKKIRKAVKDGLLSKEALNEHVRRVLLAKYNLGLQQAVPVAEEGVTVALNAAVPALKQEVYNNAITLLARSGDKALPLAANSRTAYIGVGITQANPLARLLQQQYGADCFFFDYKQSAVQAKLLLEKTGGYDRVVVGVHQFNKYPAGNFGISAPAVELLQTLQLQEKAVVLVFGNPYAVKNVCKAKNLVACYEDDSLMHETAALLLAGKLTAKGTLPVTVCEEFHYGSGITAEPVKAGEPAIDVQALNKIDAIAESAIAKGATPGCVVLVAKDGEIVFNRAYGHMNYDKKEPVTTQTVYDLASVTKISATTVSIMKLYEQGKVDLHKTLGDYLPWVRGSNKAGLTLADVLLHQAGLVAWIPFYRETIDTASGKPLKGFFAKEADSRHSVRVAKNMYVRNDWQDTLMQRILQSKLGPGDKYVYSDNDFIFLGKIVEQISGMGLDEYAHEHFYRPLRMITTTFRPWKYFPVNTIAPTEQEKYFRLQLLRGDVHDPGAALMGGVAGHAGLFSNASDLARLYLLLLNGGELDGVQLLKKETIEYFTAYHSKVSRRGLGFDKPEKDNATRKEPYPAAGVSPATFGHTGFTGTCVWADPQYNLLYIFLSNRVCPEGGGNGKLGQLNVRPAIQEVVYKAIRNK